MDLDRYINMAKPFFKSLFKKKNSKPPPSPPGQSDEVFGSRAWGRQWSQKHTKEKKSSQIHYKEKMHAEPSEWRLVEVAGGRHLPPLPRTMLFLGRDDCDINIPSRSVDKRHAVLTYDGYEDKYRVKDLSSVNGTYVNDARLPEQEYVTLEDMDTLRFGYDPLIYRMERIEEVPHLEQQNEPPKVMSSSVKVTLAKVGSRTSSPPRVTSSSDRASPPPLVTSSTELPQWAVREPSPQPLGLAECQGCIVEQDIHHTCGVNEDTSDHAHHNHAHHNHAHHNHNHAPPPPVYVAANGHLGEPLSPPHAASYNRWAEVRRPQSHQHALYRQQAVFTTSGYSQHGGEEHTNTTTSVYSQEREYSIRGNSAARSSLPLTSPTLCRADFTSPTSPETQVSSHSCTGSSDDEHYSIPPPPPRLIDDGRRVPPLVNERELAESQKLNQNGEGNDYNNGGAPTSSRVFEPQPRSQQTENFQTHFQIIPPRQGQTYRVINVQFTGANLSGSTEGSPLPPANKADVLSPASSGYQSLNASLGQFVFMTPPMDDSKSPKELIRQTTTELINSTPLQNSLHSHPNQGSSPQSQNRPQGILVNMGAGDDHLIVCDTSGQVTKSPGGAGGGGGVVKGGCDGPMDTSTPQSHNLYSPTSPDSPLAARHDQRRSLSGTEPELETIKKCTPLYGQPAWWGEEDEHAQTASNLPPPTAPHDNAENEKKNGAERPSSLALEESKKKSATSLDMNKYKTDPRYATTYMEIPQRDGGPTPRGEAGAGGGSGRHTPPEKDVPPPVSAPPAPAAAAAAGPMAFTVDLGDDVGGAPKLNMKNSLSEFLPHKVRRSFRSRSVRTSKSRSGDEKEDSPASGKASRDGSPSTRQRGRAGYHSDGGHDNSAPSSENEDLSIRSDTVTTKTRRSSGSPRKSVDRSRGPRRDRSSGRGSRSSELRKQQTSATSTGGSTSESTNYLIERMFNSSAGRTRPPSDSNTADHHVFLENARACDTTTSDGSPSKHSRSSSAGRRERRKEEATDNNNEDNVSESGTYTIESDAQGGEIKKARQSIDTVFGVKDGDVKMTEEHSVHTNGSATTVERSEHQRGQPEGGQPGAERTDSESREEETEDDEGREADGEEEPEAVAAQAKEDTPKWVSQWATLATQKTFVKSPTQCTATPIGYADGGDVLSSSTDTGPPGRKYRGTGRKLPTPPTKASSTTSPRSTTTGSDMFSARESTVSETPERDLPPPPPTTTTTAASATSASTSGVATSGYVNPRPDNNAIVDDILASSGVTSDVVTFVHDEMTDSMTTEMTDSMTSSRMTESLIEDGGNNGTQGDAEEEEEELRDFANHYHSRRRSPPPLQPVRPGASIDTEVLLKDTADVVQAMADRVQQQQQHQQEQQQKQDKPEEPAWVHRKSTELFIPLHDDESDSEGSSRSSALNGHGIGHPRFNRPKPKLFKSHSTTTDTRKPPRPFLSREQREREAPVKERPSSTSSAKDPRAPALSASEPKGSSSSASRASPRHKTTASTANRPRTLHSQKSQPGTTATTTSTAHKIPKDATFVRSDSNRVNNNHKKQQRATSLDLNSSVGSDLHSESETGSILSTSTDYSESLSPKLGRRGSKGKGPMTMTRPNRAFALRRARLEGEEGPTPPQTPRSQTNTPRSRPNSAGARDTPTARSRPSSARSEKSDYSSGYGAKNVHRSTGASRDSSVGPPRAKSAGPRTDTGRLTARHERRSQQTTPHQTPRRSPAPPSASSSRYHKPERISVSNLVATTGGSRSKPTSRSNSPQTPNKKTSDEYSAWKRRKSYDPRQAVVNAKAKAREQKGGVVGGGRTGPERSLSAGPHSRTSTMSSVSSEDAVYLDELARYATGSRSEQHIGQMSSSLSHHVEAMARSIESDDAFADTTKLSYDSVMVNSIYQLSLKVRTQTDKLMEKMRDQCEMPGSPSPTDDLRSPPPDGEIPGYKNANQELVGILRNLRKTERHLQIIDRALFPGQGGAASPASSPRDHLQYLRELERIRTEISGFRPIDEPLSTSSRSSWRRSSRASRDNDDTDVEGADPLASDEYY